MESSARLAPSHYAFITWAHILHINVQSLYLVNEETESPFGGKLVFSPSPVCLSIQSIHRNLCQYNYSHQHQFLTELLRGQWADIPGKVNGKEEITNCFIQSPPLSVSAVEKAYLCLWLPFIHQISSAWVTSAHLKRESPKHKSHLRHPTGRGSDKELREDRKINQDSIWHPGTLETQTTVSVSAVFPSVPPHSLREWEPHKWPHLWTEWEPGGGYSQIWWMETSFVHKSEQATRGMPAVHRGNTFLSIHIYILGSQQGGVQFASVQTQL